jgi:leucine dehydrogenase
VTVQGVGHVGYHLCALLAEEGARLTVADIDPLRTERAKKEFGARVVEADEIYGVTADIFAPCALGAVINDDTLKVLQVDIVAGAANNQLALPRHGEALHEREILYAPDYVINAGGLINCYGELHDWGPERSKRKAAEIYGTLIKIFELADRESVPAGQAADRLAEERIRRTRHLHRSWV